MDQNDPIVIISPHFDDAVFSVGGMLLKTGVTAQVINICAGVPQTDAPLSSWDRRCGFRSVEEAAAVRSAEDAGAWRELSVTFVNLPFLDFPYSNGTSSVAIAAALRQCSIGTRRVWAPMGIGQHPDHVASRNAVLSIAVELNLEVQLYADAPYSSARGWLTDDRERDEAFRWETAFNSVRDQGYGVGGRDNLVLPKDLMIKKLALASAYRSQLAPLSAHYPGIERTDGELSNEALWDAVRVRK